MSNKNITNFYNYKKSVYFEQLFNVSSFNSSDNWIVLSEIEQQIKTKIEAIGTPLKEWDISIYRGILTGYNEAFIIDGNKKDELIAADPKSAEIIRPILRGRDIKKHSYNFADLWLINTHNGIKESGVKRISIDDYPAIKTHLNQYYKQLENRTDKGDTPYNLRNCAYMDDFSKQKVVWKRVGSILRFSYDDKGIMALDSTCFATGRHVKFLVAILNSKIGKYLLRNSPQTGTGDLLISVQAIQPLKIPVPQKEVEIRMSNLVDIILQTDKTLIIEDCEKQIDKIIYDMLKLNKEEIEFIELL